MENKKTYILILIAMVTILGLFVYMEQAKDKIVNPKEVLTTADAKKFKKQYESYNDKTKENSNTPYLKVNIAEKNPMVYRSAQEIISLLKEGTGVIYFGFPTCPWCRNAVPVLLDAAKEENVDKVYYFNALEIRDTKKLIDGKIVTEKEGSKEYYEIVALLKDFLPSYEGLEDDSIKRLYFPTVVFVKDGKVQSIHEGTVDSQTDASKGMTDKQKEELKNIYIKGMQSISTEVCDDKC